MRSVGQSPVPRAGREYPWREWIRRIRCALAGVGRLCLPSARGVYHPLAHSPIILGVAVSPQTDLDALRRALWWRGLGLVERNGQIIAGADVTAAVQMRRMRYARAVVTRQLRDAGVRGAVKRWESFPRSIQQGELQ